MGQLHNRMEQDLKLKNVSPATRKIYLLYARKFVAQYGRPPTEHRTIVCGRPAAAGRTRTGEREIRLYLLYLRHLIEVEAVSHGTYRQCLAAIKFLYTVTLGQEWQVKRLPFPRHSRRLPVTLRLDQVAAARTLAKTA